jgi:hypothetical protein
LLLSDYAETDVVAAAVVAAAAARKGMVACYKRPRAKNQGCGFERSAQRPWERAARAHPASCLLLRDA